MTISYAILEAPSTLGLTGDDVARLPERLLDLGLAERLGARHAGRLEPPAKSAVRDPETGILNLPELASWSPVLADAVGEILHAGEFPVVLGGDCTILLGAALALRRRGRYGLLFIDGHADFFQPEAEPNGEGASMDLAFSTGHGPKMLADLEGLGALVQPTDTVAFGFRDHEDQREYRSQPLPEDMMVVDLPMIRKIGIEAAAREAVARLAGTDLEGFFIHLDADCLDDAIMPAVDFRIPGGLSRDELVTVLLVALGSGRAVGIEVTIYNPALDKDGEAGRALTNALVAGLRSS